MNTAGLALQPLNPQEMLDLSGGMEELKPSLLSSLAYDIGWFCGRTVALILTVDGTNGAYYYAKTGLVN